jgi:hypothetical protein
MSAESEQPAPSPDVASKQRSGSPPTIARDARRKPLPAGYREGVITAITVFIGFSLAFLRFWAFEAPGEWTASSIAAVVIMVLPICAQIYALYRALLVEDDDEQTYRITIKWFVWSIVGMMVAVCLSAIVLPEGRAHHSP